MKLGTGRIVVPIDGSKNAEAAIAPASQLAEAWHAPVEFIYVVEHRTEPVERAAYRIETLQLQAYLTPLLERSGLCELDWTCSIRFGPAAAQVLDAAEGARVIVMATRGRGGVRAAFLGSVTDKVVRSGLFPVVTVPAEGRADLRRGPILVPLDGSTTAEAALGVARPLAGMLQVPIALLRAYSAPPYSSPEFGAYYPDALEAEREAAESYLAATAGEGEKRFAVMRPPVLALEDTANEVNAGLIVMTSRGKGLAHRLALGSTTDRAIHTIRRPILVLPSHLDESGAS
jgi:nucleotide-binding universal stress UspA family protein